MSGATNRQQIGGKSAAGRQQVGTYNKGNNPNNDNKGNNSGGAAGNQSAEEIEEANLWFESL